MQETGKIAKVGGWELDTKTLEVSWTEQTYHIHEVPLDYKPPLEEAINFYHPDDRDRLSNAIERALKYGEPFDMELRFITAKGNHLWVHTICDPQIKDGEVVKLTGTFQDITERKKAVENLESIEWLLTRSVTLSDIKGIYHPPYGDVTALNTCRVILDSVGQETLKNIAEDAIDLLDTSVAIYEENGDYAFGIFSSGWCQFIDKESRKLCGDVDNREALRCGKWLCHESCWSASKASIQSGQPIDSECVGGIYLYALPIFAFGKAIGAINIGYGDPPKDEKSLLELAERFKVDIKELREKASRYESRPPYIIRLAKKRIKKSAKLIGEMVERRQVEEALKINEKRYQKAQQIGKTGNWEYDIKTTCFWGSEEAKRIYGFEPNSKSFTTEEVESCIPERERVHQALVDLIERDIPYNLEFDIITKDTRERKTIISIAELERDAEGNPLRISGVIHDITQSKKTDKMLAQSKQLLQNIVDTSPFHIVCLDPEGKYMVANRSYCESFGISTDKIKGLHYSHVLPPMLLQRHKSFIERALTGEIVEFEDTNPPGSNIPEYAYGVYTPIRDEKGDIQGCVVYVADITEIKKIQQALEKSEKELRQLNDTKDKFFSIIAHDLRSPLGAFQSGMEILIEHLQHSDDEYAKKVSNSLYKTALQVYEFLENLLEWSRFQWGLIPYEPKKIDLNLIANYVLDLLSANAKKKNIDLHCLIKDGTFVYADYDMLKNILNNLISNAIKFTKDGGKILIDAKETGDFMEVSVTDNGVGMTPEKIERLFKIGEQKISSEGTAKERGTGLGLILCKEFVEKNGGRIWVESRVGMGSSLKFTLPI